MSEFSFAKNFSRWLKISKLSVAEFSRQYGVKRRTVESWLRSERTPNLSQIAKLGLPLDFLVYGRPKPAFPFFGENVSSEYSRIFQNAYRELISLLDSYLKGDWKNLAISLLNADNYDDLVRLHISNSMEIQAFRFFSFCVVNLYFSLYFGNSPFPVTLPFLHFFEKSFNLNFLDLYNFFEDFVGLFPYNKELEKELLHLNEVTKEIFEQDKEVFFEFCGREPQDHNFFPFFKNVLIQFDSALKTRTLPLVCFIHFTFYFGSHCPVCYQFLLDKEKTKEKKGESENG